jgi:RNA polymerase sigma-70 factor (ECF subfamily)
MQASFTTSPSMAWLAAMPVEENVSSEFEQLMVAEERRLFTVALAILRDPVEAEDAVQETAISAWKKWDQRRETEKTRAWLTTICVRHCIRQRRGLLKRLFITDYQEDEAAAFVAHVRDGNQFVDLDEAFSRLSRQQRAIVNLHYQHGYQVKECAEIMGCSAGAAASHLSRALAKLRREISND